MADVCVVGIADDYSGEVPLAFVMLEENAARRAKSSPKEAEEDRQSIMKVNNPLARLLNGILSDHL